MPSQTKIFSDKEIFDFLKQTLPTSEIIFKNINKFDQSDYKSSGIIFLTNKIHINLKKLSGDFLIFLNESSQFNQLNKNITFVKTPLTISKITSHIKRFIDNKKITHEDIFITNNKLINNKKLSSCHITDIEKNILIYLISIKSGSKEYIKKNILNIKLEIETNSLESHLTRIRKKLNFIESNLKINSKSDSLFLQLN